MKLQIGSVRLGLLLIWCSAGSAGAVGAVDAVDATLFGSHTARDGRLVGVWESHDYGWILSIADDDVSLFDITCSTCTPAVDTLTEYETYFHSFKLSDDGMHLQLRGYFEPYTYYFDRAERLPRSCVEPPTSSVASTFDSFVGIMERHYAFFDERDVDWASIVTAQRTQVDDGLNDDELWTLLKNMLEPIDDGHVMLTREVDGETKRYLPGRGRTMNPIIPLATARGLNPGKLFSEWEDDYRTGITHDLLNDDAHVALRGRLIYGHISEDVGYINLFGMGGFVEDIGWRVSDLQAEADALNAALDDALIQFDGVSGLVIDLSHNGGGLDYLGRAFASHFIDEPRLVAHRFPATGSHTTPQPVVAEPSSGQRFLGPIVVLTSNLTVSAGESLTMAFRARPRTLHIGEATRGALSEVLTKTLPNGWQLSVSNEHYVDAEGISWEARGITPEWPLQVFEADDIFQGHIDAVGQAAAILRTLAQPR